MQRGHCIYRGANRIQFRASARSNRARHPQSQSYGSESKDEDMGAYLAAADRIAEAFKCLVIIVHHCGIDLSRPRGHTSLTGAVDTQIAVKRGPVRENMEFVASIEFVKDGQEGEEIWSVLDRIEMGADDEGQEIALNDCPADRQHRPQVNAGSAPLPPASSSPSIACMSVWQSRRTRTHGLRHRQQHHRHHRGCLARGMPFPGCNPPRRQEPPRRFYPRPRSPAAPGNHRIQK